MIIQRRAPTIFNKIDPFMELSISTIQELDYIPCFMQILETLNWSTRRIAHIKKKAVYKIARELNELIEEKINSDVEYKNQPDRYLHSDSVIVYSKFCIETDNYFELHNITESELFSILVIMEVDLMYEYFSWLKGSPTSPINNHTDYQKVWYLFTCTMSYAFEAFNFARSAKYNDPDLLTEREELARITRAALASKAGKSKGLKNQPLKQAVLEHAKSNKFKSAHHAAEIIWNEIQNKPSEYPECYLTKTRGKATIYEWIRKESK